MRSYSPNLRSSHSSLPTVFDVMAEGHTSAYISPVLMPKTAVSMVFLTLLTKLLLNTRVQPAENRSFVVLVRWYIKEPLEFSSSPSHVSRYYE